MGKEDGKGNKPTRTPRPQRNTGSADEEIHQRTMPNKCPPYCSKFVCKVDDNCNNECNQLDYAQALICELCADPCDNEKQKQIFLNTKYLEQKQKEFSSKIIDGAEAIKNRHNYLETRLKELRMEKLKCSWYQFNKKSSIAQAGLKIKFELELVRRDMDWLEIPYIKEVEL